MLTETPLEWLDLNTEHIGITVRIVEPEEHRTWWWKAGRIASIERGPSNITLTFEGGARHLEGVQIDYERGVMLPGPKPTLLFQCR